MKASGDADEKMDNSDISEFSDENSLNKKKIVCERCSSVILLSSKGKCSKNEVILKSVYT